VVAVPRVYGFHVVELGRRLERGADLIFHTSLRSEKNKLAESANFAQCRVAAVQDIPRLRPVVEIASLDLFFDTRGECRISVFDEFSIICIEKFHFRWCEGYTESIKALVF
jgi:hypothetical protein